MAQFIKSEFLLIILGLPYDDNKQSETACGGSEPQVKVTYLNNRL